jgi:hypothetical protein
MATFARTVNQKFGLIAMAFSRRIRRYLQPNHSKGAAQLRLFLLRFAKIGILLS